jgi:hypothetical protein
LFFVEAKQVFETFDKRYEGKVDSLHIGDMLRALNLAPTVTDCEKRGQGKKAGKIDIFKNLLKDY